MGQRVRANDDDEVLMDTGGGGGGDSSEVDTINEQAASACDAGVRNAVDEEAEAQQQAPADDHSNDQRVHAIDDGGVLEAVDTGYRERGDDNANKETASAGDADAEESLHYKRPVSCPNNNN